MIQHVFPAASCQGLSDPSMSWKGVFSSACDLSAKPKIKNWNIILTIGLKLPNGRRPNTLCRGYTVHAAGVANFLKRHNSCILVNSQQRPRPYEANLRIHTPKAVQGSPKGILSRFPRFPTSTSLVVGATGLDSVCSAPDKT